ncbi:unnamed protein product, partial [Tuber aestivum]
MQKSNQARSGYCAPQHSTVSVPAPEYRYGTVVRYSTRVHSCHLIPTARLLLCSARPTRLLSPANKQPSRPAPKSRSSVECKGGEKNVPPFYGIVGNWCIIGKTTE